MRGCRGARVAVMAFCLVVAACGGSESGGEPPDAGANSCNVDSDCEDLNFCTHQWCDNGTCQFVDDHEGEDCDDGNVCTENGVCQSGTCEATALDCSAITDTCNQGVCDPSSGTCVAEAKANGDSCDDGSRRRFTNKAPDGRELMLSFCPSAKTRSWISAAADCQATRSPEWRAKRRRAKQKV